MPPKERKPLAVPRPSSSVLVISPTNQVLLLHRVRSSSSFPSAHVFPGGNVDEYHDGTSPAPEDPKRHEDSDVYRMAAIRETFEESGILLARNNGFGRLIEVNEEERNRGRKLVHGREMPFQKWLSGKGGRADLDGLIPFTRWVTPTHLPKRFTTQMYIYFLPLPTSDTRPVADTDVANIPIKDEAIIPTPDGGIEHTAARFLSPQEWMQKADTDEIILFPPQYFLLHLIAPFLKQGVTETEALSKQRQQLKQFIRDDGSPSWGQKCISPMQILRRKADKRNVLALDKPGHELEKSDRRGDSERVVLVDFRKEGPRKVQVRWKKDVMEEERQGEAKL